jgi:hypothetical protein
MFMFIVYKDVDELLMAENNLNREALVYGQSRMNSSTDNEKLPKQIINSNIISFKINNKDDIDDLKHDHIELIFKHLITNEAEDRIIVMKPVCSYWDYNRE